MRGRGRLALRRRVSRRHLALHRRGLLRHDDRRGGEQRQREERATNHVGVPPEGAREPPWPASPLRPATAPRRPEERRRAAARPVSFILYRQGHPGRTCQGGGSAVVPGRRAPATLAPAGFGGDGTFGSWRRTTATASPRECPRCTSCSTAVETSSRRSPPRPLPAAPMPRAPPHAGPEGGV